jgi:Xaa-Pro aminopeptidase
MADMQKIIARRNASLRKELREHGITTMLVTSTVDVGYLSGFSGDDSWLLVGAGKSCLITDFRYEEQAERECPPVKLVVRKGSMIEALAKEVRRRGLKRLAYDPEAVTVGLRSRIEKGLKGVRLVAVPQVVGSLRIIKDEAELAAIRTAVAVAEEAFGEFRKLIRLGMTEQRLAAELDHQMRLAGAEGLAFPTIIAVDASASMPHARPGQRRLKKGSVLLVDFGARAAGYVSDLTRVLVAGRIPPRVRRVYEIVREAQVAGIAAVKPGALLAEVDAAARDVIKAAGYGDVFQHGTGHGIGREIHEAPALSPRELRGRLRPGMVITIEPGIYLRNQFGIRIEDDVLVTNIGHKVLSGLEKRLDSMVL